jgi:hypothetical protein
MENISKMMSEGKEFMYFINSIDEKYEEYVRKSILDLISSERYDDAKNKLREFYANLRVDSNGVLDKNRDTFLLGYENINCDINCLIRGINNFRDEKPFSGIYNIDSFENSDLEKAIAYNKALLDNDEILSNIIRKKIDVLLNDNKIDEALIELKEFYKDSFVNDDYTPYFHYFTNRANIFRKRNHINS